MRYNIEGRDVSKLFDMSLFPAGEHNILIKEWSFPPHVDDNVFFVVKGGGNVSLMEIGMKVDILRRAGCKNISVVIPYLPYSRQDRYTVNGASFSLKVFATFINSLGLNSVYTVDAHSDVSGVVDNLFNLGITDCVDYILTHNPEIKTIIAPDAGATKKIYDTIGKSKYKEQIRIKTASKHRDIYRVSQKD